MPVKLSATQLFHQNPQVGVIQLLNVLGSQGCERVGHGDGYRGAVQWRFCKKFLLSVCIVMLHSFVKKTQKPPHTDLAGGR